MTLAPIQNQRTVGSAQFSQASGELGEHGGFPSVLLKIAVESVCQEEDQEEFPKSRPQDVHLMTFARLRWAKCMKEAALHSLPLSPQVCSPPAVTGCAWTRLTTTRPVMVNAVTSPTQTLPSAVSHLLLHPSPPVRPAGGDWTRLLRR